MIVFDLSIINKYNQFCLLLFFAMQTTNTVLMVRPEKFEKNQETAFTNEFQKDPDICLIKEEIQAKALQEFERYVDTLRRNGIEVLVVNDEEMPHTPDSIFPNNWISFHADLGAIIYPMQAQNRREEKKLINHVLSCLEENNKIIKNINNLSSLEEQNEFLEGTGSMVLDRVNKLAYIARSPRSTNKAIQEFEKVSGYKAVVFSSQTETGIDIYHTNVMMAVGRDFTVICLDSIQDLDEKYELINSFNTTRHEIIPISLDQVRSFAGNMLEIESKDGERVLVMSQKAYRALNNDQLKALSINKRVLPIDIETIEKLGGGSVRCMLAEVF